MELTLSQKRYLALRSQLLVDLTKELLPYMETVVRRELTVMLVTDVGLNADTLMEDGDVYPGMTSRLGISIPGMVRDMISVNTNLPYSKCAEISVLIDERLNNGDWLQLYNGKTYDMTFDPTVDPRVTRSKPIEDKHIDYVVVCTKYYPKTAGGYGSMENYVIVTRTRDGKIAKGIVSGDNASKIMYSLCGGYSYEAHWTFAEREVGGREYHAGIKNGEIPFLHSDTSIAAAQLVEQLGK